MKKVRLFIIFVMLFSFLLPVHAEEFEVGQLIAVGEKATVKTEKFIYQDFVFTTPSEGSSDGKVSFTNIKNPTRSKMAVSINLLLFGENKKNIGLVTYCSDKDFDSNYSGFKLKGGQSSPFAITVSRKYLDGESVSRVFYVAVLDENKYCQIGNYSRYAGKTIEEIFGGEEETKEDITSVIISKIMSFIDSIHIPKPVLYGIGIFLALLLIGLLLNALHSRMYRKKTIFAFLPLSNMYIAVMLSFGKIVGIIFLVFYLISAVLFYFNIRIVLYIISGLWILCLFIVIIKLITRNYDLFILDPSMNDYNYPTANDDFGEDMMTTNAQPMVDLSYSNMDSSNQSIESDNSPMPTDRFIHRDEEGFSVGNVESPMDDEEEEDETDLSKLFR